MVIVINFVIDGFSWVDLVWLAASTVRLQIIIIWQQDYLDWEYFSPGTAECFMAEQQQYHCNWGMGLREFCYLRDTWKEAMHL